MEQLIEARRIRTIEPRPCADEPPLLGAGHRFGRSGPEHFAYYLPTGDGVQVCRVSAYFHDRQIAEVFGWAMGWRRPDHMVR
jgi:hypothetical protein